MFVTWSCIKDKVVVVVRKERHPPVGIPVIWMVHRQWLALLCLGLCIRECVSLCAIGSVCWHAPYSVCLRMRKVVERW